MAKTKLFISSVQVMLFSDRLEVINPGALPLGWTIEKLKGLHTSVPANPLLAEPMYLNAISSVWVQEQPTLCALQKKTTFKHLILSKKKILKPSSTDQVPTKYPSSTHQVPTKFSSTSAGVPQYSRRSS